jgi:hypothetical protein
MTSRASKRWQQMKLSKYFTLSELEWSSTANRLGIDNSVDDLVVLNDLSKLCLLVLDPVREQFGPFSPTSGYRCLELNRYLGSKDTSQHILGRAADIKIPGILTKNLFLWIKENLQFDQLILEFYDPASVHSGWVHVSYVADNNQNESFEIR